MTGKNKEEADEAARESLVSLQSAEQEGKNGFLEREDKNW